MSHPDTADVAALSGTLELHGRIAEASNGAYLGTVGDAVVIYKPIRSERPLWDFPGAVLAHREVAAYRISQLLGWDVVPATVLREGPLGPGMVQRWCEPDQGQHPVDVVPAGPVPAGHRHVFDGIGPGERPVQLVHESHPALLRMAVFDVIVNNADRKGGHVLAMADGRRLGIDHGITFHADPKLRTVLWGWAGEPVPEDLVSAVASLPDALGDQLDDLLSVRETEAVLARAEDLVREGVLPHPSGDWPAIPWPPF